MAARYVQVRAAGLRLSATATVGHLPDPAFIVVEPGTGSRRANCYLSLAEANSYFVGRRLHSSAWTAALDVTKVVALKQATALLDAEFTWTGSGPIDVNQALGWPRTEALDRYNNAITGVPKVLKDAVCELAFYLLDQDRLVGRQGVGLESLRVDVISLKFDKTQAPEIMPPHVSRMLVGIGTRVGLFGTIKTTRLQRV